MNLWLIIFPILAITTLYTILLNIRLKKQLNNIIVFLLLIAFIPLEYYIRNKFSIFYFYTKTLLFLAIFVMIVNIYQHLSAKRIFFDIFAWLFFIISSLLLIYLYSNNFISRQLLMTLNFSWLFAVSAYTIMFLTTFFNQKLFKISLKYKFLFASCLYILIILFLENILLESLNITLYSYDYFKKIYNLLLFILININYIIFGILILLYLFNEEYSKVKDVIEKQKNREKDSDFLTIIQDLTIKSNDLNLTIDNIINISNFLIKPDGAAFYLYDKNENMLAAKSVFGHVIPPFFTNDKILSDYEKLHETIKNTKIMLNNIVFANVLQDKKIFFITTDHYDKNRQYLRPLRDYALRFGSLLIGSFKVGEDLGGILYLNNRLSDFNELDKKIFESLCSVTGVLISNIYSKELSKEKDRLKNEMNIAEQIQTSILPKKYDVPGYKICPYMKPADEVGGDYYDIINTSSGKFWVNIGDVTGHGLTAGLIMLMLQTSASTNIKINPNIKPSDLMINSNKTIFDNIKNRLLLDQYITACFFSGNKNGEFEYAGAHEDIIIYRKKTKKIERIPTIGIWLGLTEDISKIIKTNKFKLEKDDLLFIFTDGVIEIMNEKNEQYDIYRLEQFLVKMGDKEPEDIRDSLNIELNNFKYEQKDDITFIIIKKL
ncbi:MAG: SpoIIE family protein phosphatase [Spirochaetes bacterium]|nr:SpoIIE family protein phosphatase [Spirochaetota bacterium]